MPIRKRNDDDGDDDEKEVMMIEDFELFLPHMDMAAELVI